MKILPKCLVAIVLGTSVTFPVAAQQDGTNGPPSEETAASEPLSEEYSCMFCHGKTGSLSGPKKNQHLIVTEEDLAVDIHWGKGLRCHDCHGGSPTLDDFADHRDDPSFRSLASPKNIPAFCGHCHSNTKYMRHYRPSPRVDQEAEYWTSGHGQRLQENGDAKVATCVSCHGGHGVRAVGDLESPVYPTRVAETCASCHSDAELMSGREYHGRPLGHDQHELWSKSVHAQAMMEKGDLSAATCNDCHGNHGAVPPDVDSVANACGTCHVKVAQLFSRTIMKHRFEEVDLPGCATCHGNHEIHSPADEMLGMAGGAVCARCHKDGEHGATLAGAEVARQMHSGLVNLVAQIGAVEEKLDKAERLGMEVRGPRFHLREASDALTNARSLVHSFEIEPVQEAVKAGEKVTSEVNAKAESALQEYTNRRIWLGLSLVPILVVVALLVLYIRTTSASQN